MLHFEIVYEVKNYLPELAFRVKPLAKPISGWHLGRMSLREHLLAEHQKLEAYFERFLNTVETADRPALMTEWTAFEKSVVDHFDDEEKYMFTLLEKSEPDEVRALRAEHDSIKAKIGDMGMKADLRGLRKEDVEALLADLKAHKEREEALLYPWADDQLPASSIGALVERIRKRADG